MKENQVTESWAPAVYIRPNGAIINFNGLYEVSDQGRVKSLNYKGTGKAKVMNPGTIECSDGTIYYKVELRKDHKNYSVSVHRLVLSTFRPNGHPEGYFPKAVVDHIDARSSTSCVNKLANLRWVTQQQNTSTENSKVLRSKVMRNKPDRSKRVKVTNLTTREITMYPSAMEAGRALSINPRVPSNCIKCCKGYYKKLNLHFAYV